LNHIPNLFILDANGLANEEIAETWVFDEPVRCTRMWDGQPVLLKNRVAYKHIDAKPDKVPDGFIPSGDVDAQSGKIAGWVPVSDTPFDAVYRRGLAAFRDNHPIYQPDGTYELVGGKNSPDKSDDVHLESHWASIVIAPAVINFNSVYVLLREMPWKGLVWHSERTEGKMCKVTAKQIGLKWPR